MIPRHKSGYWAKAWGGRMNHFWLNDHNRRPLCQPRRKNPMTPHLAYGYGYHGYTSSLYCGDCKVLLKKLVEECPTGQDQGKK